MERSGTLGIRINMHTALKERKRRTPESQTIAGAMEILSESLWSRRPDSSAPCESYAAFFFATQGSATLHLGLSSHAPSALKTPV